eukprot:1032691-Rhodomonas_salina.1
MTHVSTGQRVGSAKEHRQAGATLYHISIAPAAPGSAIPYLSTGHRVASASHAAAASAFSVPNIAKRARRKLYRQQRSVPTFRGA